MVFKLRCAALCAIFAALVLFTCACEEKQVDEGPPPVRPVKTILLEDVDLAHTRNYPGKVQPTQDVDLSFRISGPLVELPVNEGQMVEEGDLIARIDPRDYQIAVDNVKSSLKEARAQLQAMKTGARPEDVKMLEAELQAAEANYRAASQEYKRIAALYEDGAASKSDYDKARQARDVAAAQYKTAQQNLEKGKKGARAEDVAAQEARIDGLEAQLAQAEANLEDTYLKAPFNGVVAQKYIQNYTDVQAKQPVVNLQDLSEVEIQISLPERIILMSDRQEEGYQVTAVFDSFPERTFDLKFKEIATQPDPQTKTYNVTLIMPYPEDLNVLPGMTVQVALKWSQKAGQEKGVFQVPVEAVFGDAEGDSYVWTVDDQMTVHQVQVKVGEMTEDRIVVLEGLEAGDRIVVAGVSFLMEGQKVRLMEDDGENAR